MEDSLVLNSDSVSLDTISCGRLFHSEIELGMNECSKVFVLAKGCISVCE